MQHLISNIIIQGQHRFVLGKSTQTQLLAHYKDLNEAMTDGAKLDTALDFSKAFGKDDLNILLNK